MGVQVKSREEDELRRAMADEVAELGPSAEPLPRRAVLCYGTGHMLNDLTAACWFTYLLIFLTDIGLSPRYVPQAPLSFDVVFHSAFMKKSFHMFVRLGCISFTFLAFIVWCVIPVDNAGDG